MCCLLPACLRKRRGEGRVVAYQARPALHSKVCSVRVTAAGQTSDANSGSGERVSQISFFLPTEFRSSDMAASLGGLPTKVLPAGNELGLQANVVCRTYRVASKLSCASAVRTDRRRLDRLSLRPPAHLRFRRLLWAVRFRISSLPFGEAYLDHCGRRSKARTPAWRRRASAEGHPLPTIASLFPQWGQTNRPFSGTLPSLGSNSYPAGLITFVPGAISPRHWNTSSVRGQSNTVSGTFFRFFFALCRTGLTISAQ